DYLAEGMRFGASIWDYYVEYAKCLDLPQVLVVCFEDLDANLEGELPRLAEFLGLPPLDAEATQRVLHLCSRQSMLEMSSKFDESWTYSELRRLGRAPDEAASFAPAARVHKEPSTEVLDEAAKAFLQRRWREVVEAETGAADDVFSASTAVRNTGPSSAGGPGWLSELRLSVIHMPFKQHKP
ncbi:UVR8, partial [Symbiodinium sp. KB8]